MAKQQDEDGIFQTHSQIMKDNYKEIGQRVHGLRQMLDLSAQQVAELCGRDAEWLEQREQGEEEFQVGDVQTIAHAYGVPVDLLLFGDEPRLCKYALTRTGEGAKVERSEAYEYQCLASRFSRRMADPFMVVVKPRQDDAKPPMNAHAGQEFDMVFCGQLELTLGDKVLTLNEGDSIYFDSSQPHCMRALGGKPVKFLAIVF